MVARKTAEHSASGRSRSADALAGHVDAAAKEPAMDQAARPATNEPGGARKTAAKKPAAAGTAARKRTAAKNAKKATAAEKAVNAGETGRTGPQKAEPKRTAAATTPAKKASHDKATHGKAAQDKAAHGKADQDKGAHGKAAERPGAKPGTGGAETEHGTPARDGAGRSAGRKSTGKKAGAARAAKQTGATTVVAKKTPGTAAAATTAVPKARAAAAVEPGDLAVRPGEDPWTPEEVAEARAELQSEMERLRDEISSSEQSLAGLMRDSGDGAGDDQADTGTKNITREHEMALAANAREMLTQTGRALDRLDAGTYGLCENCGNPIGKARMQAFPRATLCVECKQKQERRY
ncbi:TraR/DksA family transcriptional regulator [Streptomyces naganishii]|uniref:Zinc finger DksA/TraR C4-type domain-containing protein n=1 Tax=Streptomyces naganishii JCM 4654 TaxID=1306179 RepID=A0A918XYD6_9ACTN|nr:TraR/DksA family transcriptional regulator [Streptomyces naganishii]GHD84053.1 hypothetical protein GCM10010508_02590 [Streptomyces naganishii JCM 4654]